MSWAGFDGGDGIIKSKKLSESRSSSSSSSENAVRDDELEDEATLERGTTSRVAAPPSTLLNELETKH